MIMCALGINKEGEKNEGWWGSRRCAVLNSMVRKGLTEEVALASILAVVRRFMKGNLGNTVPNSTEVKRYNIKEADRARLE